MSIAGVAAADYTEEFPLLDRLRDLLAYGEVMGRITDDEADLVLSRVDGYGEVAGHRCRYCSGPLVRIGERCDNAFRCAGPCERIQPMRWPWSPEDDPDPEVRAAALAAHEVRRATIAAEWSAASELASWGPSLEQLTEYGLPDDRVRSSWGTNG